MRYDAVRPLWSDAVVYGNVCVMFLEWRDAVTFGVIQRPPRSGSYVSEAQLTACNSRQQGSISLLQLKPALCYDYKNRK